MTPPPPPPRRPGRATHSFHPLGTRGPRPHASGSTTRTFTSVSALSVLGASGLAVTIGAYAIPAVLPVGGEPYTSPPPALPTSTTSAPTSSTRPAPTETITDRPTSPSSPNPGSPTTFLPPGSSPVTPPGTPAPSSTAPAPAPPPSAPVHRTFTGKVVKHRFGPVQVRINLEGTRIVGVDVVQRPTGGTNDTINDAALPKLTAQTLRNQNGKVDAVSGATLSSNAYRTSLQSALDQAKG